MPIPGDNGKPRLERAEQELRITSEARNAGFVQKELRFNPPAPKQKTYLGEI